MSTTRRRARVCLFTTSHPVTYSRFLDREAQSLTRAGYDVVLVGVGDISEICEQGDVRLVSVPGRRLGRKPAMVRQVEQIVRRERADVYHCLDPWALSIGLKLKSERPEAKLVYEASEWFPRMMLDRTDLPLPARWLGFYWVERLERRALALADAIIDTNATRARRFAPSRRQPVLVPNFPRVEDLPTPAATREPCFAFTGLASRHRGFDVLLRALALVVAERPEARLRVVGGFDPRDDLEEWTRCFARLHGIAGSLELYGWLPYRQMFEAIRSCCVGLILFQPRRANDYTGQPNKLFEFMGSGLAVIAPDFPETGPVVRRTGCGWLVDPTRPEAIAAAMAEALAEPVRTAACAESGRRAVLQRYNWARAEEALLQLYGQLSGSA